MVTEDGTIVAWNEKINKTNGVIVVTNSASGAVHKGVSHRRRWKERWGQA